MKFNKGDVIWITNKNLFPQTPETPYEVTIVSMVNEQDVCNGNPHYIVKVYTCVDNYYNIIEENRIHLTRDSCRKDAERKYFKHKESLSKMKKAALDAAKGYSNN